MQLVKIYSTKSDDLFAMVDDEDEDVVNNYRWNIDKNGYAIARVFWPKNTTVKMHRIILEVTDPAICVDHKNNDKLDNQKSNLRLSTRCQNQMNRVKNKNGSSDFKGVSKSSIAGKYRARITKDYKEMIIGYFDSPEEAARAYDAKAKELFGDYAKLNFPEKETK